MEERLLSEPLTPDLLRAAKRLGFGDEQIANLAGSVTEKVRQQRLEWGIRPVYKMVDTCAAEFAAATPYFYSTYEEENEALPQPGDRALVVGSGPIRIGQGIEFDYASVKAAQALRAAGYAAIMANSNPETVSTDFDTSDRLYFEPLDEESALDMLENEAGAGGGADGEREAVPSILQFGGQTAINLAGPLTASAQPILGSSAEAIDLAEDRKRFEHFLTGLGIPQPPGTTVSNMADAIQAAATIGYPVLVRPSYVLGGRAMEIVQGAGELARYVGQAMEAGPGRPVLIDKYFAGIEVEVDAICDGESVLIPGIMEHIERAGVHSGDSMAVYPAPNLTRGGDRPAGRLHAADRAGPRRARADEHPVRRDARPRRRPGRRLRAGGQPAREPHGAVPQQGDDGADGRAGGQRHAGPQPARPGLRRRAVAVAGLGGDQGAGVQHVEAGRGRYLPGAGDEVDRRGDGRRPGLRRGADEGAAGQRPGAAGARARRC